MGTDRIFLLTALAVALAVPLLVPAVAGAVTFGLHRTYSRGWDYYSGANWAAAKLTSRSAAA